MRLEAGDVLVVPHGDAYMMGSAPDVRSNLPPGAVLDFFRQMASPSAPVVVTEGGGGPDRAHVVCGFLGCDVRPFNPVLEALPRALYLRRTAAGAGDRLSQLDRPGARRVARAAAREPMRAPSPERVAVRGGRPAHHLDSLTREETGWLAGLRDPIAGRALARLHQSARRCMVVGTARQGDRRVAVVARRALQSS